MLERVFQEAKFRVCCLGGLKLMEVSSGTDMTPTSRKARALIGYLCIVGKPVGRERLASLLWGDRGDEQARASLRQTIYELRSLLGGDRLLRMERDTVAIGEDVSTDMAAIIAAAQSGDLEQLSLVLSEWRGDFFEDLPSIDPSFDAWLQSERLRVQESLVDAAAEAVRAGMARAEIDPARKIVNLLQQRDSTNEVVLRLGLRLDHLAGDTAALHRRYERFRELLKSELDAAPSAETQRLFQELAARLSASLLASEPNGDDAEREHVQQGGEDITSYPARPFLAQSTAEAEFEKLVPPQSVRSSRRVGIAGVAFAVASLCALAWVIWSPLHKAAPSSVRLAPDFAKASSTLAAERRLLAVDTHSEQEEDHVAAIEIAARVAAQRALARDPNNGEALGVLALLTSSTHLQEIDRLFERALRSDPKNPQLLNWHGEFLMMVGRSHEALEVLTRAYELDRATPSVSSNFVLAFLVTGRFEEGREIIDLGRNNRVQGQFFPLHVKYFLYRQDWLGLANYLSALPDDLSPPRAAFFRLCRETAIALATRQADKFGQLRSKWRTEGSFDPDDAVQFLSALGDGNGALEVVRSAVMSRQNDEFLTDPEWEAFFAPNLIALRRDPRVRALLAQWGLFDYWRAANHWPDFMR
jgi:DNA-binding SARP family transcriptional activator